MASHAKHRFGTPEPDQDCCRRPRDRLSSQCSRIRRIIRGIPDPNVLTYPRLSEPANCLVAWLAVVTANVVQRYALGSVWLRISMRIFEDVDQIRAPRGLITVRHALDDRFVNATRGYCGRSSCCTRTSASCGDVFRKCRTQRARPAVATVPGSLSSIISSPASLPCHRTAEIVRGRGILGSFRRAEPSNGDLSTSSSSLTTKRIFPASW